MTDELIEAVKKAIFVCHFADTAEAQAMLQKDWNSASPLMAMVDKEARAAIRVIAPAVLEQAANVAPAKIRAETCETVGQWERRALREAIRALKEGYTHDQ